MAQEVNPRGYTLTAQQERVLDTCVMNAGCWTSYFTQPGEQQALATLVALGYLEYELETGAWRGTVQVVSHPEHGQFLRPVATDK